LTVLPQELAEIDGLIAEVQDLVTEAAQQGQVGNTVVIAMNSTVDITNTINSPNAAPTPEAAQEARGFWSWVLRHGAGLTRAMEVYGKVHGWSSTPAGAAIMQRLAELLKKFLPFFGG